jgi:hypothetical protein
MHSKFSRPASGLAVCRLSRCVEARVACRYLRVRLLLRLCTRRVMPPLTQWSQFYQNIYI